MLKVYSRFSWNYIHQKISVLWVETCIICICIVLQGEQSIYQELHPKKQSHRYQGCAQSLWKKVRYFQLFTWSQFTACNICFVILMVTSTCGANWHLFQQTHTWHPWVVISARYWPADNGAWIWVKATWNLFYFHATSIAHMISTLPYSTPPRLSQASGTGYK